MFAIIVGLLVLGILILVHELGHFLVAKAEGIRVLAFSIGFGPVLFSRQKGETEYRVSSIPFGGYVKMEGEDPEEETNDPRAFSSQPIWQRALVAFAGPFSNYLFSFILLGAAFLIGVEEPLYTNNLTIGDVAKNSPASEAGIMMGDSIVAMGGEEVSTWNEVQNQLARQKREYTMTIRRDGSRRQVVLNMSVDDDNQLPDPLAGLRPPLAPVIGQVVEGDPADDAGIRKGDSIVAYNGDPIYSWYQFAEKISNHPDTTGPARLRIARNDSILQITVEPEYDSTEKRYLMGIAAAPPSTRTVHYSFGPAVARAFSKSGEYATLIFTVLGRLFTQDIPTNQLAGPVGIIQMSGAAAGGGLSTLFMFAALIGINLAVLNLLPLVITDGGQIVFLAIEGIRGKPVNAKTRAVINQIAVFLFIALFLYVTFNDIQRIGSMFGR